MHVYTRNLGNRPVEFQRQEDGENRATGDALAFDCAVVLRDKSLRDGQAQAAATLPSGHQRKENLVANRFRNAGSVVLDRKRERQPMTALGQRNAASYA